MSQRQVQEQQRLQEARRVDRQRQQEAGVRDEESIEKRRYLRQVQQELEDRKQESALLKVLFNTRLLSVLTGFTPVIKPTVFPIITSGALLCCLDVIQMRNEDIIN